VFFARETSFLPIVKKLAMVVMAVALLVAMLSPADVFAVNVLTYHNDNARTGANTNETLLTPANVNTNSFGRLFQYAVDGYVYAQPLYLANLAIPGQGTHNVVFVATEHNTIYAFDADGNGGTNGGLLWSNSYASSAISTNSEFGSVNYTDLIPEVGITGTPVIDAVSGTLYVDVLTREVVLGVSTNYYHRIHALNITNGMEQSFSPVIVSNSVPGTGVDSSNGVVVFNARQQLQRPALTLAGGMLYVAYGSYGDADPFHGWIMGFNATNLQPSTNYVFNTTPNSTSGTYPGRGAIWMGGGGLSVDANTNLFFETGNGSYDANTSGGDYGDSFLKVSTSNHLMVADYFTPYNQLTLANDDLDLGSEGVLLLPDSVGSAAHPHLIVGSGKGGTIYLVDRDNMGHYNGTDGMTGNDNQIVQEIANAVTAAYGSPAYFNGLIYYQGCGLSGTGNTDVMKAFLITNGAIATPPSSESPDSIGFPGATPSISANGMSNAIVWAIDSSAYASSGSAVLRAYNATNLALKLYSSNTLLARDNPGNAVKFTVPTVANGKVYVGAQYGLSVFGLTTFVAPPIISPNGGNYVNSQTVTLSDVTAGVTNIYYTLDGTMPTTNSLLYSAPFVISNTVNVEAIAVKAGSVSSVANALFVNTASPGQRSKNWSHQLRSAVDGFVAATIQRNLHLYFYRRRRRASVDQWTTACQWLG
jgi:hypothetical protein